MVPGVLHTATSRYPDSAACHAVRSSALSAAGASSATSE